MNNIEQRRFYTFVFYYHLTSLFEVDTGNPRVTRCCEQEQVDFNRRVRERLQDTPRRHPRAFEEALANLGPAGGTTNFYCLHPSAAASRDWYLCPPERVVLSAPRSSLSPFYP